MDEQNNPPTCGLSLNGYTEKLALFLLDHPRAIIDDIAIHLGLDIAHTRDILFRARERGIAYRIPITYSLTKAGRIAAKRRREALGGSPSGEASTAPEDAQE